MGGINKNWHPDFPIGLSKVVAFLQGQISPCLIPPYQDFFKTFDPMTHDVCTLKSLLSLAMSIDAGMDWMTKVEKPSQILIDSAWLNSDE